MKREIRLTEDGSHTLYVPGIEESYHSVHGAIQESSFIYIEQGLNRIKAPTVNILELGFGTGLNAMLTLKEAIDLNLKVSYHAVEKYPLEKGEYSLLNYESLVKGFPPGLLTKMHESGWGESSRIHDNFTLYKEQADLRSMQPTGPYNLVYFDAFAPQKQAHLWTEQIFTPIYEAIIPGGILLTYTSMGSVRRALISCGFTVERIPGPPGKRHILRATKG